MSYNTGLLSQLNTEERIQLYEQKYKACMDTKSGLSIWLKLTKEKGPPSPLREGYIPPASRSRFANYFSFSTSHSTAKRRSFIPSESVPPVVKSSFSTLLKKASDSFSSSSPRMKQKPNTPNLTIHTSSDTNQRFSLSNSFSRPSTIKNGNAAISEHPSKPSQSSKYFRRFSTSIPEKNESKNQLHNKQGIKARNISRPMSAIFPPSPTSLLHDTLYTLSNDGCQKLYSQVFIAEDVTPPSSPSSMTSPPNKNDIKQKKKRTSLLMTPSLSSIRFISQKPNFLRRQSIQV